jgi:hypothetical protein
MDGKYYARRLEERLPKAMQGGPKMSALFETLGQEMSRMANGATLLMRSRWHALARGWTSPDADPDEKQDTELGCIGGLFGLKPGRDEGDPKYRRRLIEFVKIHRVGLGSAPALLRLVALVYRAESSPEIVWSGGTAAAHLTVGDETGHKRLLRLELLDNPPRTAETVFKDAAPGTPETRTKLIITNYGLDAAMPTIELTAKNSAVAVPMLTHEETGNIILYTGRVPQGMHLCLRSGKPPLIDGFLRNEAPLRYSRYDEARFDTATDRIEARFAEIDFDTPDLMLVGHGFKFGEFRFYSPTETLKGQFASFGSDLEFPLLHPGESRWSYCTLNRAELASYLGNRDDAESLLQYALEKGDPQPVDLKFSWQERVPACLLLRIPGDYVPPFMNNLGELEQALNRALDYGRAAGVKARLEVYLPFKEQPLEVRDHPGIHVQTDLREEHDIEDKMAPPAMRMKLAEQVDADDRFGTSGVYDHTHLDHARFVSADNADYRGRYDQGQYDIVKYTREEEPP